MSSLLSSWARSSSVLPPGDRYGIRVQLGTSPDNKNLVISAVGTFCRRQRWE